MMGCHFGSPLTILGMYSFKERKAIARQLADPDRISVYRKLLSERKHKLAGAIMTDKSQLAAALVYALLAYCTADEIASYSAEDTHQEGHVAPSVTVNAPKSKVRSKFEEYPKIRWKDLDNSVIRTADSIYSDRINCWSRLKELELQLDGEVERDVIAEYVDLNIRLELCFEELRSLNDKGAFIGKHPFVTLKSEKDRIEDLLKNDPEKYFDERKNIEMNISRYSSYLKSDKYRQEKKHKFGELLERYKALLQLYKEHFKKMYSSETR